LGLPGVVDEHAAGIREVDQDWPLISEALHSAMDNLAHMRVDEGKSMAADLKANCRAVAAELDHIGRRAPLTVDAYRNRLKHTWRPAGNNNPLQRLLLAVARRRLKVA